LKARFN
jgi:HSP20 family molecular chaperone IbpA